MIAGPESEDPKTPTVMWRFARSGNSSGVPEETNVNSGMKAVVDSDVTCVHRPGFPNREQAYYVSPALTLMWER